MMPPAACKPASIRRRRSKGHFDLLGRWLRKHGRPLALYTDRDSIFETQSKGRPDYSGQTQFGRALAELGIERIPAYSPQAKGRIERFFGTAQDRWVKELRLAGVTTRAQANALLRRKLLPEFNRRFTVAAARRRKRPSRPRAGARLGRDPQRADHAGGGQRLHSPLPQTAASRSINRPGRACAGAE